MANTAQSIKRARQAETRRQRKQGVRTKCRTLVKRARIHADSEKSKDSFISMQSFLDRAGRKGIMHVKTVARLKRRINHSAHLANKTATTTAQ